MEDNSDILSKYQKLAHEYSKLKAQTSVLKTAIGEEQAAAAESQETLKKRDQLIRKLEQEVECLNFRNLQLTKRVSVLQNELEGADANAKISKGKHMPNHSPLADSYGVLNLELQSRIEENEKLHKQVYAADLEHKKEISELTSTIEKLQNDLTYQEKRLNEKIVEQEAMISNLQKEKIKMQVTLKNFEKEIKEHKKEEETKSRDSSSVQQDLQIQLENTKNVIADKVLFNDTYVDSLNSLNVPVMQRSKHEQLCKSMGEIHDLVSDFCRQLSDLYTFMIQRLCSTNSTSEIQDVVTKLESKFRDSISHIKTVPINFEKITSAIKDESLTWDKSSLLEFSNAFQKYVIFLDVLMPYLVLRVQNKESWISSSPKAVELVPKLITLCKKLMNCFKKLQRYIDLLGAIDGKTVYTVKQSVIVQKLFSNLEALQLLFEEARKLFGTKITLDYNLPIITQDEKSTDECILSTLVSLSTTLKKLTSIMSKNLDILSCDTWYKPRNCAKFRNSNINPYAWQYKNRGSKYFQIISQSESPSIPYEIALKNQKKLQEHSDNQENLSQQLEHYQNKLMQLELDKEKWMLECTLMKAKETQNSDTISNGEQHQLTAQGYDEIHKYVQNTVNQLIQQIQFADSKFIAYRNECGTLHQKLKMCYQKKETLENEIRSARQTIEQMKEEQKNITHSYEDQLNTMNEHLANLNETLTAQKDEIDALKQSGSKGSKKGRSR